MKFSDHLKSQKSLNFFTTIVSAALIIVGATLGVASIIKIVTITHVKNSVDPALFFLTTAETQILAGLLEISTAFVLLSKQFSLLQKYITLVSLTTSFCAYRYFSLPLPNCGCLGNFETEWLKDMSSFASTVLLSFYLTVSVLIGFAVICSIDLNNPKQRVG